MKPDYRHALRLFVVIGGILGAAAVAKTLAVPAGYGQFGNYRGDAPAEAQARASRHLGEQGCEACHAVKVKLHDKDAHRHVQCETCHGPGDRHAAVRSKESIKVPRGQQPCLVCHQRLDARPGSFPQITVEQHFKFVGVKELSTPCIRCHDPHEPLYMDRDLNQARLHPMIQRCRDCHTGPDRAEETPRPAGHPAIFQCSYCHPDVVKDFKQRTHKDIRCTTCHIFFPESESAGRIIRDADPRFCLLCHRGGDFRSDSAPPSISWPAHREEMGSGPEDAAKRCIDCHQEDNIHAVGKHGSGKPPGTVPVDAGAPPAGQGAKDAK